MYSDVEVEIIKYARKCKIQFSCCKNAKLHEVPRALLRFLLFSQSWREREREREREENNCV